ncbi:MAG: 2TM domain-containing protein [Gomphosphaeria aponina SAG 52.96 = DSM 107014]|uniref:2TM domain-containing protein n=1 Tax=Gomphosphaeria aponina SAG 52.96 = DSM 107014 TaxID=1521640 RepID=A0A941GQ55_9CHRO|nr:2TM domain-containing protein [Gomphosphaeria aponina SAG 52.96 = DSM 107014]
MTKQHYSQAEIQEILNLAIARQTAQTEKEELSREQLQEIATELGIDSNCLETAEIDWLALKSKQQKHKDFQNYRRGIFKQKAGKYLIFNSFFVGLNILGAGAISWSLYILLIWGLKLSLEGWQTFQAQGRGYEIAFSRWQLKQEMKQSAVTIWRRLKQAWET